MGENRDNPFFSESIVALDDQLLYPPSPNEIFVIVIDGNNIPGEGNNREAAVENIYLNNRVILQTHLELSPLLPLPVTTATHLQPIPTEIISEPSALVSAVVFTPTENECPDQHPRQLPHKNIREALKQKLCVHGRKNVLVEYQPGIHFNLWVLENVLVSHGENWMGQPQQSTTSKKLSTTATKSKTIFGTKGYSDMRQFLRELRMLDSMITLRVMVLTPDENHDLAAISDATLHWHRFLVQGDHNRMEIVKSDAVIARFLGESELVVLPHKVIVSPVLRNQYSVNLSSVNSIIFDNSGDLEEVCTSEASVSITNIDLNKVNPVLRGIRDLEGEESSVVTCLENLSEWLGTMQLFEETVAVLEKLVELGFQHVSPELSDQLSDKFYRNVRLRLGELEVDEDMMQRFRRFLWLLPMVFQNSASFLLKVGDNLSSNPTRPLNRNFLKIFCGDASLVFKPVCSQIASSVIACGPNMAPVSTFRETIPGNGLGVTFEEFFNSDPGMEQKYLFTCSTVGPGGKSFRLSKKTRIHPEVESEVFASLVEICKTVPGGILVLFPSGKYLDFLLRDKVKNGVVTNLKTMLERECHKTVVAELYERNGESDLSLLRRFQDSLRNPGEGKNGTVFMTTHEGSLYPDKVKDVLVGSSSDSVGIRAVVHVGLPFPAWYHDDRIMSKRKYFENLESGRNVLAWYTKQSYRLLNHSFPLLVESQQCQSFADESDRWGMVILLEGRVLENGEDFKDVIPYWVRQCGWNCFGMEENDKRGFHRMMETAREFVRARSRPNLGHNP